MHDDSTLSVNDVKSHFNEMYREKKIITAHCELCRQQNIPTLLHDYLLHKN